MLKFAGDIIQIIPDSQIEVSGGGGYKYTFVSMVDNSGYTLLKYARSFGNATFYLELLGTGTMNSKSNRDMSDSLSQQIQSDKEFINTPKNDMNIVNNTSINSMDIVSNEIEPYDCESSDDECKDIVKYKYQSKFDSLMGNWKCSLCGLHPGNNIFFISIILF
jgi:hypothetical protein